jgi:hypothetical protein
MHQDLDIPGEEASEGCRGEFCLIDGDERFNNTHGKVGEDAADGELDPVGR